MSDFIEIIGKDTEVENDKSQIVDKYNKQSYATK